MNISSPGALRRNVGIFIEETFSKYVHTALLPKYDGFGTMASARSILTEKKHLGGFRRPCVLGLITVHSNMPPLQTDQLSATFLGCQIYVAIELV